MASGDVLVTRMNAERQGETTIPNRGFTPTDSAYHPTPTNRVTPAPMDQHTAREPRGQRKPDHHNRSLNRAAAGARQATSTRAHNKPRPAGQAASFREKTPRRLGQSTTPTAKTKHTPRRTGGLDMGRCTERHHHRGPRTHASSPRPNVARGRRPMAPRPRRMVAGECSSAHAPRLRRTGGRLETSRPRTVRGGAHEPPSPLKEEGCAQHPASPVASPAWGATKRPQTVCRPSPGSPWWVIRRAPRPAP